MNAPHALPPAAPAAPAWQRELARAYARPAELLADLGLAPDACGLSAAAARDFPLRVPRGFVARMRRGDPADPLLRQVLPAAAETVAVPGFVADPVGDLAALAAPGVLRKYAGRALLIATGACAINCRYCFRREFPYGDHAQGPDRLRESLALVAADPAVSEVILSGGDPLLRTDAWLADVFAHLGGIGHVKRLRIHTRVPVVLPERVDEGLTAVLGAAPRPVAVVLHCNHPQEIDAAVRGACARLRATGATLLNQAVLLRGVNDDAGVLVELAESLYAAGVLPYYLHQLDAVRGAAHFAVDDDTALRLDAAQRARLPGYLVPRLVREVPGASAKTPLTARATT
jgi:EF-P beta-lysylation protein EpmB